MLGVQNSFWVSIKAFGPSSTAFRGVLTRKEAQPQNLNQTVMLPSQAANYLAVPEWCHQILKVLVVITFMTV